MAENSKISWTTHTFNAWVGCTKISPACHSCYAEAWAKRTGQQELWQGERRRTSEKNWNRVRKWDRDAAARQRAWDAGLAGLVNGNEDELIERGFIKPERPRVFCSSLADVFDNQVPAEWRVDLWRLINATPNLDWLLLTKRPQNVLKMLPSYFKGPRGNLPKHIWFGTTVENQEEARKRIPHMAALRAAVNPAVIFLSCEPLLGPLDLMPWLRPHDGGPCPVSDPDCLGGEGDCHDACQRPAPTVDWVIAGGESGPHARPMHPEWASSLRDQARGVGVPFHFKQWGDLHPHGQQLADGSVNALGNPDQPGWHALDGATFWRVGKAKAGALLDGHEWQQFPAVRHDG